MLSKAENISVLLRFPWELLLNPLPSLVYNFQHFSGLSLFAVLFLSTGAAFVQCQSLLVQYVTALSNTGNCIISLGVFCIRTYPTCLIVVLRSEILTDLMLSFFSNSIIAIVSVYLYQNVWAFNEQMGLGWRASIQVTLSPIDSIIFNSGDWTPTKLSLLHNLEGDHHHLERIITSHSLHRGIITPRKNYLLSHYPGGLSPPREDYRLSLIT